MNPTTTEESRSLSKEYIIEALFILLKKHSFNKITVNDICAKAGISRVTYYRHFHSKIDIIKEFLIDVTKKHLIEVINEKKDFTKGELVTSYFETFKEIKDKMLILKRDNLLQIYLTVVTDIFAKLLTEYTKLRIEQSYVFSGAIYNCSLWWLDEDCATSPEEMAKNFIYCFTTLKE